MKKRRSFLRRVGPRARGDSDAKEPVNEVTTTPFEEVATAADAAQGTEMPQTKVPATIGSEKQEAERMPMVDRDSQQVSRLVSVIQACEEIWKCQEPQQAAQWLEILHHSLLRMPLDAYQPSEVFVCISGAALRFQDQESPGHDMNAQWNVWEEAMWAAAALARVCVGAAWRRQLRQRKAWIHRLRVDEDSVTTESSTQELSPLDVVSTHTMPRSFSPMTSSTFEAATRFDTWYLAIPENLPAAMLRFAAIETLIPQFDHIQNPEEQQLWLNRRKSLAEAQRELVLALCYILPEELPDDPNVFPVKYEWNILEAHVRIINEET